MIKRLMVDLLDERVVCDDYRAIGRMTRSSFTALDPSGQKVGR